ncbi:peptidase m48 ste24p [Flammeovirgaceae bacterium 311]|nr:peptidase m48 ste24p [Flammeovirgaceae bacterium 311]
MRPIPKIFIGRFFDLYVEYGTNIIKKAVPTVVKAAKHFQKAFALFVEHIFRQNMKRSILTLITAVLMAVVSSCSTVPLTGRRQLSLVPDSQILPMSFQQYQQVMSESKLSNNQQYVTSVRTVGQRISKAVEQYMQEIGQQDNVQGFQWEFNVIAEDQVNAWAMPGGKVAFYEGIMPITQNETGIAVVMGHEVAHAIAKHGSERMSQQLATQLGGQALSVALQSKPQLTQQLAMAAFGAGSQVGVLLPYARDMESEADRLGLIFMARAGYDPRQAPQFWERMQAKSGGGGTPVFLSTHPHPETRIKQLNQWMPEALKAYQQATGRQ